MGGLKLQHSSGSPRGLWKFRLSGPNPTVFDPAGGGGDQEFVFLPSSQVMLVLPAMGLHFENQLDYHPNVTSKSKVIQLYRTCFVFLFLVVFFF